jgi:predicted RNA binding protein YcfA (HicA-like mRNA interferase family)
MTTKDKIFNKLINTPQNVRYKELEALLFSYWYIKIEAKWSHMKFKHKLIKEDLIIPVHNWNCKIFYKNWAKENILFIKKQEKWNTILKSNE